MSALPTDLTAQIGKLLPRLASNHVGEVTGTAAAIGRKLSAAGRDWHDLAAHLTAPPPVPQIVYRDRPQPCGSGPRDYGEFRGSWRDTLDPHRRQRARITSLCKAPVGFLSAWEASFVASLDTQLVQGRVLSAKQGATLDGIFNRFEGAYG